MPRPRKVELTKAARNLFRELGLGSEVKWNKVSGRRAEAYKRIVEFFFSDTDLRFRVIIVDQMKFDPEHHGGDRELGFNKFYYELLIHWLEPRNQYLILLGLDFKQNQSAHRYHDLRTVLTRRLKRTAHILDLTVIDSRETPLAQVCDVLTGATAATWCDSLRPGGAKEELAKHIAGWRGVPLLKTTSLGPGVSKFNVFQIELRRGILPLDLTSLLLDLSGLDDAQAEQLGRAEFKSLYIGRGSRGSLSDYDGCQVVFFRGPIRSCLLHDVGPLPPRVRQERAGSRSSYSRAMDSILRGQVANTQCWESLRSTGADRAKRFCIASAEAVRNLPVRQT